VREEEHDDDDGGWAVSQSKLHVRRGGVLTCTDETAPITATPGEGEFLGWWASSNSQPAPPCAPSSPRSPSTALSRSTTSPSRAGA
jgi:hypothetical protein